MNEPKRTNFQRLLRETDIEGSQLITMFAEREEERVERRQKKVEGRMDEGNSAADRWKDTF